jgi:hypothetical protein
MASAAAARKWPRLSQGAASAGPTSRRAAAVVDALNLMHVHQFRVVIGASFLPRHGQRRTPGLIIGAHLQHWTTACHCKMYHDGGEAARVGGGKTVAMAVPDILRSCRREYTTVPARRRGGTFPLRCRGGIVLRYRRRTRPPAVLSSVAGGRAAGALPFGRAGVEHHRPAVVLAPRPPICSLPVRAAPPALDAEAKGRENLEFLSASPPPFAFT